MSSSKIAFLGLGMMGLPMATRLVQAGFDLSGYDVSDTARGAFAVVGGTTHGSAAEALAGCKVVITMLPTGKIVRETLTGGAPPLCERLPPKAIVVDMSSSEPTGTQELAAELARRSIILIDAPVSGGVARARTGALTIMAGGDHTAIAEIQPILASMGNSIFPTGPVGSAHAMKALNNYVSAAGLVAACEAVQIGGRFGIDPSLMVDVLNASTGRNNSTEVKMKPFIIGGAYNSGFSLALMAKDLRTADDLARHLNVPAPLSQTLVSLWRAALDKLGPHTDHTEINRFLATDAAASAPVPSDPRRD